jgi:hypothetical protein
MQQWVEICLVGAAILVVESLGFFDFCDLGRGAAIPLHDCMNVSKVSVL